MNLKNSPKKNLLVTLLSGLVTFSLIGFAFFWMYSPIGHVRGHATIADSDKHLKEPIVFTQNLNKELLKICQRKDDNLYIASYNQDVGSGPNFIKPKMRNIQGEYKTNIQIQGILTYKNKCLLSEEGKLKQVNTAFTKAIESIGEDPTKIQISSPRTNGTLFNARADFNGNDRFYRLSIQKDNVMFSVGDKIFDPQKVEYISSSEIPKILSEDRDFSIEEFTKLK